MRYHFVKTEINPLTHKMSILLVEISAKCNYIKKFKARLQKVSSRAGREELHNLSLSN